MEPTSPPVSAWFLYFHSRKNSWVDCTHCLYFSCFLSNQSFIPTLSPDKHSFFHVTSFNGQLIHRLHPPGLSLPWLIQPSSAETLSSRCSLLTYLPPPCLLLLSLSWILTSMVCHWIILQGWVWTSSLVMPTPLVTSFQPCGFGYHLYTMTLRLTSIPWPLPSTPASLSSSCLTPPLHHLTSVSSLTYQQPNFYFPSKTCFSSLTHFIHSVFVGQSLKPNTREYPRLSSPRFHHQIQSNNFFWLYLQNVSWTDPFSPSSLSRFYNSHHYHFIDGTGPPTLTLPRTPIAYGEWCRIRDLWRRRFSFRTRDQGPCLITQELLCSRILLKYEKGQKVSDIDIRRGMESAPLASFSKGVIYFFLLVITINQKNVSKL